MPFPKPPRNIIPVYDRIDTAISIGQRVLGALGLMEDENAQIMAKLDQLIARREFTAVPALGWDSLSEALSDLWQQITNTHGSVNTYGGQHTTYLSQIAPDAEAAREAAEAVLERVRRSLAGYGEGNVVQTIPLAESGTYGILPNCVAVEVHLDAPPPGWSEYPTNPPHYGSLGRFSWQYKGTNAPDQHIRYLDNAFFVLGPVDACTIHLQPAITGSLSIRVYSEL